MIAIIIIMIIHGISTLHSLSNRYLQPPEQWVSCTLESRELLGLCLKKIKGLTKVRILLATNNSIISKHFQIPLNLTVYLNWGCGIYGIKLFSKQLFGW